VKTERFCVLNEDELQRIDAASIGILAKVGIRFDSKKAVEILHGSGAQVDGSKGIVKIPEGMARSALETTPSRIRLYDRGMERFVEIGKGASIAAPGHNAVKFIDHRTGEQRSAVCTDCDDFVRLVEELDEFDAIAVPVMPQDVHSKSSILHGFLHTVYNTTKHIYFSPDSAAATEAIIRMASAVSSIEDPSTGSPITCQLSPTSPLVWDPEAAEGIITCAKAGIPMSFLPQPFSGMTAPITVAGLLAQHNAELLSGVVLSQLVHPGTPVIYGSAWTTFDMKSANIILCSPEAACLRVAGVQLASLYNLPSHTIGPDADAHIYDEQLGWEKLLSTISAIGAGVDLLVNAGLFDSAWTASLEQVVLDAEILSICHRFMRGIEINDTTLALDVISDVGPGGHFMENEHTIEQLRAGALWEAGVSNTYTSKQWEEMGKPTVLEHASKKVDELLSDHTPIPLSDETTEVLKEIIRSFESGQGVG
jgi:trimethylamine--corrinoid protein Co-methyltransferase